MGDGKGIDRRSHAETMRILIVDDEPNIRKTLRVALEAMGHAVEEASGRPSLRRPAGGRSTWPWSTSGSATIGLDLIEPLLAEVPRLAIVVITAHASIDTAVDAIRRGAFDYLPKPFTPAQVRAVIERVGQVRGLRDRVEDLEGRVATRSPRPISRARTPRSAAS